MNNQQVKILDYHRNGVSGIGFYVGIVKEVEGKTSRTMLVIRFPKQADNDVGGVLCAAFDLAKLDQRNIHFGENSWRGDYYHTVMDQAIKEREGEL